MAAEYEIKEVGFIGSLWQGEFNSPINVGKTIEVTNVPNTIESGRRQSIFISTNENLDVQKFNNQLPDLRYYYEFGKLVGQALEDLSRYTKIDKTFLSNLEVLYRFDRRDPGKTPDTSRLPIQQNWSFDTSVENDPVYIYNSPESIVFTNYVFLVSEQYQNELVSYFSELQQENFLISIPPPPKPILDTTVPKVTTVMYPQTPIALGGRFREVSGFSDEKAEQLALERFTNDLNFYNNFIPPIEVTDVTTIARPQSVAEGLFDIESETIIRNNLRLIDDRISKILDFLDKERSNAYNPFTFEFSSKVEVFFYTIIKNYLLEKLSEILNTDIQTAITTPVVTETQEETITPVLPPILPPPIDPEIQIIENQILEDQLDFEDFIDEIIEDLEIDDNNTYVFKKISKVSDYDLPILKYKTKGLFRCTGEKLSTFYTGSLSEKQQKYYLTVFNEKENTTDSYHQFDITYCHISGSGSSYVQGEIDLYPAKTMYRKYMLECFGHTNGKFPFKNGKNGDYFYAIQLDRDQFIEKIDLGNFELALCELSSSGTVAHGISNRFFTLIDESKDSKQEIVTNEGIQEYYYITSGSIRDGVYNETEDDAWGVVFPKMGLIILDGVVMDQSCSFNTITGSVDGQNSKRLFLSVSGAAVPTPYRPSGSFFARSFETVLTETYFCRADMNEFNNSTNYTYVSGSDGFLKYDYFKNKPHSYITTIGLYNRKKELLAIGKLRSPILKNDGKVCTFEVVVRLN
jgi:hypothetical protein